MAEERPLAKVNPKLRKVDHPNNTPEGIILPIEIGMYSCPDCNTVWRYAYGPGIEADGWSVVHSLHPFTGVAESGTVSVR
jgi:hypothetical protein